MSGNPIKNGPDDTSAAISEALLEWFWTAGGADREAPYELDGEWLRRLYGAHDRLRKAGRALAQKRPAMAIWGPSQTGKSTSVSAYMDAGAEFRGEKEHDGRGSGLHWAGGRPFFFMAPRVTNPDRELPPHLTAMTLNPFNQGMDGSSCLSRFTPGSPEPVEDRHHVRFPDFPVELELVSPADLWHALARGYATECLDPRGREPRAWDLEGFKRTLKKTTRGFDSRRTGVALDRTAFERLCDFAKVVAALADGDERRYSGLSDDAEEWGSVLRGLFEEPALLADAGTVDALAAEIFWDGCEALSDWFGRMRSLYEQLVGRDGAWQGKRLCCSLEATMLFLNMGACEISYANPESNPNSPRAIIQGLISELAYTIDEDSVKIGCSENLPHSLSNTPEDFCLLQGLVWELVVPVNLDNLPDRPFPDHPDKPNALKEFLGTADLLDFPGVGNDTKALENRVILASAQIREIERKASARDASPADVERRKHCFSPVLFFKEIVKRGKTASIVSTYAERLNIDGFSIFQGLRTYKCPNADQLINGVKSWWRNLCPEYLSEPNGPSPYPLNLVLTWWAKQLNYAVTENHTNIYGAMEETVSNLGRIRDPSICTTFAIHDHCSPDRDAAEIKQDFDPDKPSVRYQNLTREAAFTRQFGNALSRKSFDAMLRDRVTGGAEFFFTEATAQMREAQNRSGGRAELLARMVDSARMEVAALIAWQDLIPRPKPRDDRREHLEAFHKRLTVNLPSFTTEQMREFDYFLRCLLNVAWTDLAPIPSKTENIDEAYIHGEWLRWCRAQAARHASASNSAAAPLAASVGLAESGDVNRVLSALAESLRPDLPELARWLISTAETLNARRHRGGREGMDLRRLFAVRMANTLVYGDQPASVGKRGDANDGPPYGGASIPESMRSAAYTRFVKPFTEDRGRLWQLYSRDIAPRKRPDLPGDAQLLGICRTHGIDPQDPSLPGAEPRQPEPADTEETTS